jgi:hypothetical protein
MASITLTSARLAECGVDHFVFGRVAEFRRLDDAVNLAGDAIPTKIIENARSTINDGVSWFTSRH